MRTMTSWLLAGALAASLTWNWKLGREHTEAARCAAATSSCLDGAGLGLAPAQEDALEDLCATSCAASDRLERRANELQAELLLGLSAAEVDEQRTAALIEEVGELRKRSLAACVEGILGVREVLSPEEVRALLARCEQGAASCR